MWPLMQVQVPTPPTSSEMEGWVITILILVVVALTGTIVYLSKLIKNDSQERIKALEENIIKLQEHVKICDQDKEKYLAQVAALQAEVTLLKVYFQTEVGINATTRHESEQ